MVMLFAASALVLASCGDDTDVKDVELTLIPAATSGTHFVGDVLSITLNAKGNSDNKLKALTIVKSVTGSAPLTVYKNDKLSGTDFIYALKDTLETTDTGTVTYTFTLTGEKGNASVKNYTATVRVVGLILNIVNVISLKGQLNTNSPLHFMKLTPPFTPYSTTVTLPEFETCDLAFYFGSSNRFTISSPSDKVMQGLYSGLDSYWSKAKVTGFYKAGANDLNYQAIVTTGTDMPIVNYAQGKTFSNTVTNLITGDVILFKTAEGKLGLIQVKAINPPQNAAATNASMDIVVAAQIN